MDRLDDLKLVYLDVPGQEVWINGDQIGGLLHLLKKLGILGSANPLILTFDPNFQRDIQAGCKVLDELRVLRPAKIC